MPTAPALTQSPTVDKFSLDKSTSKGITTLTLHGTLDHAFEGKKTGTAVTTKRVILNMRGVKRFASWGMSEWMDFLRITATRDVYLVECSTYAVSQLNLVTGLLGTAKLVSFYASYRCASCSGEEQSLFLVPRDRDVIRDLPTSTQDCRACGGLARLEEYPAAFFETIADRAAFDIDDEVLAHLRSQYKYDLQPDTTRFRAYRKVDKDYTYLRISGTLAKLQAEPVANACSGITVVDLRGAVFDPTQVTPWRHFIKLVLPRVKALQLLDTPPGFLQSAVLSEDLHDKVKVRTIQLVYDCARCHTRAVNTLDVAENLEELAAGAAPQTICVGCKASVQPSLSMEESTRLRALPARERDPALDKLLAKARAEPLDKLQDTLSIPATATEAPAAKPSSRGIYVAIALSTLVLGGLVVGFVLWNNKEQAQASSQIAGATLGSGTAPIVTPPPPDKPAFERPDWVMFDVPASGYCHDMINRLMCVGVSSFRGNRDEAVSEANEVALDELVTAVGLKITDATFKDRIIGTYSDVRSKALSSLEAAQTDRAGSAYAAAATPVGKARKRVVEILQASGGAAVPPQRSDWYWEEYDAKTGGTEFLVFVRYDVPLDSVKALVDKYSTPTQVLGSTVMTAFPALAWKYADFTGGAMIVKTKGALADAGAAESDVVMQLGEHKISDAAGLVRRIEEFKKATGDLSLTIKTGDAAPRAVQIPRYKVR